MYELTYVQESVFAYDDPTSIDFCRCARANERRIRQCGLSLRSPVYTVEAMLKDTSWRVPESIQTLLIASNFLYADELDGVAWYAAAALSGVAWPRDPDVHPHYLLQLAAGVLSLSLGTDGYASCINMREFLHNDQYPIFMVTTRDFPVSFRNGRLQARV